MRRTTAIMAKLRTGFSCTFGVVLVFTVACNLYATSDAFMVSDRVRAKRLFALNNIVTHHTPSEEYEDSNNAAEDKSEDIQWVKITSAPKQIITPIGGTAELWCEAIGSPPPSIYWLHNGKPLQKHENFEDRLDNLLPDLSMNEEASGKTYSRLNIPCVKHRNSFYTCVAKSNGHSAQLVTRVSTMPEYTKSSDSGEESRELNCMQDTLQHAPQAPLITLHNPLLLHVIGKTLVLTCKSQAVPRATIHWTGPSNTTPHGQRFKILESGSLQISPLKWDDMGQYTCTAENSLGQDSGVTFVYPMQGA